MTAFSQHTPRLQLAWDASSLKAIQFCPRFYQYQNLEGWQGDSVDLEFGRYIADGFERFQKFRLDGLTREDALLATVKWVMNATWFDDGSQWGGRYETMWKCEGTEKYKNAKGNRAKCPNAFDKVWFPGDPPDICVECRSGIKSERLYLPGDTAKHRKNLVRALIWYGDDQPEDLAEGYHPYTFPDGTKAVELSGRIPLPFKSLAGESFMLTWNFDYIGEWGSELFITDNKTTRKTLNSQFFEAYSPDTQFDTYAMVGTLAYPGLDIKGVMLDGVQVLVSGVEFGKHPYYKTEEQHEEHLRDLEIWIRQAEQYALANYWPMNKRSCWLCPFKRVCSQSPGQRKGYLKSNFNQRELWDPLKER